MAVKEIRKIKEMRPKFSSHLNICTATTSITTTQKPRKP